MTTHQHVKVRQPLQPHLPQHSMCTHQRGYVRALLFQPSPTKLISQCRLMCTLRPSPSSSMLHAQRFLLTFTPEPCPFHPDPRPWRGALGDQLGQVLAGGAGRAQLGWPEPHAPRDLAAALPQVSPTLALLKCEYLYDVHFCMDIDCELLQPCPKSVPPKPVCCTVSTAPFRLTPLPTDTLLPLRPIPIRPKGEILHNKSCIPYCDWAGTTQPWLLVHISLGCGPSHL